MELNGSPSTSRAKLMGNKLTPTLRKKSKSEILESSRRRFPLKRQIAAIEAD